jgi:UDP-3-O-[3-hydroxymyristoyl] glucosamine N-acyltransferase
MPDFFPTDRELTIEEIVKLTGAKPRPDTPLDRRIRDIAPLDRARSTDITFLDNPKYLDALATTRAGVCLTAPRFAAQAPDKLAVLVAPEPYRAFVMVARAQNPRRVCRESDLSRELDHIVEDRRLADMARPGFSSSTRKGGCATPSACACAKSRLLARAAAQRTTTQDSGICNPSRTI